MEYRNVIMPVRKLAISLPEDVVRQVDRAAAQRGVTRSRFIADVLRVVAQIRADAEITARIDALVGNPEIAAEQRETAAAYQRAGSRHGTEW
jgi:metal-responsive CopG/Arc/MetJ family transcriptional regulator